MDLKPFDISKLSGKSTFDPSQIGYEDSIDIIKDELRNTQKSFVKIGWYLKHIDENNMYIQDGYKDIFEFALDKFGISSGTANRFINVCKEFSKGHDSPELDDKYCNFKVSQLFEMLPMKEDERDEITPDMSVKEIRETKEELKAKKEPSIEDIKAFYLHISDYLPVFHEPKEIKEHFLNEYGKGYKGEIIEIEHELLNYCCTPRGISINNSEEITWLSFANKLWDYVLYDEYIANTKDEKGGDNINEFPVPDEVKESDTHRHRDMTNEEKQEYDELIKSAEQMSFGPDEQIVDEDDRVNENIYTGDLPYKLFDEADEIVKSLYHALVTDNKTSISKYTDQIKRLHVILYKLKIYERRIEE